MKKLMLFAVCVMAVMISCKQKGQTAPADTKDSVSAVIDSIIEENDTTPMPMFIIGGDGKYMHMLYWANIEEPKKNNDNADYFESWYQSWTMQEMFRRNAAQYVNLLRGDKTIKIKYVDEILKDPDGNTPSIGEIHGRAEIPSLCARFDYVNPKDRPYEYGEPSTEAWGTPIVTDSYLKSRKQLEIKSCNEDNGFPQLSADIVGKMEKEYGMKAARSSKLCMIGGRYTHGVIEFEGEYKNGPKDPYDKERKYALALELIIDSGKIYKLEKLGYYSPEYGSSWNADADGYLPNDIEAAFEGKKGLELCYSHAAPESFCVGMIYLRDDKLIEHQYEMFHALVDEEIPVWKKDFAEMDKIYHASNMGDDHVKLTKWAHCYIDFENEWIWLRDKDDKNGAFFIREDGKLQLIAIESPRLRPSKCSKDGVYYLKFEGSAGGPSWQREIHAFKGGKRIWQLNVLEVSGEMDGCELNGKEISIEEGKAMLGQVPQGEEINAWFKNINGEE